jgi:glycosyltransferase involved in cell wall biosynthesis
LRDSVIDGKTGLLVKENGDAEKLAEAIIKVLKDEEFRRTLSVNALEYSKNFSWDKTAEGFLKVVESVLREIA